MFKTIEWNEIWQRLNVKVYPTEIEIVKRFPPPSFNATFNIFLWFFSIVSGRRRTSRWVELGKGDGWIWGGDGGCNWVWIVFVRHTVNKLCAQLVWATTFRVYVCVLACRDPLIVEPRSRSSSSVVSPKCSLLITIRVRTRRTFCSRLASETGSGRVMIQCKDGTHYLV